MDDQPWWGCEFLEFENPSDPSPPKRGGVYFIPTKIAMKYADPVYHSKVMNEDNNALEVQIRYHGIKTPVTFVYDRAGRLRYHDGYHRLCAAQRLGVKTIPARLEKASGLIKTWCLPFISPDILEYVYDVFSLLGREQ